MATVSKDGPYKVRVDSITAEMEADWRNYGFRSSQEMIDWYFYFVRKFEMPVVLRGDADKSNVLCVQMPDDMLKIYPLEKFRQDEAGHPARS